MAPSLTQAAAVRVAADTRENIADPPPSFRYALGVTERGHRGPKTLDDSPPTLVMRPSERPQLPSDPRSSMTAYAPPSEDLLALARYDSPESGSESRRARSATVPLADMDGAAPEWMRAAKAMTNAFEACIERGEADPFERAAIERAWYAYTMGGVSPRQVMRVVRLVGHAQSALANTPPERLRQAVEDCSVLIYNGLPSIVRSTVPFDRVRRIVNSLSEQSNAWVGIVEGSVELLGWKDAAQAHAASILRSIIDQEK